MKTRIISAIVALLIIVPIIYIGGPLFSIAATALGVIALNEMFRLRNTYKPIPFGVQAISYIVIVIMIMSSSVLNLNFSDQFGISELVVVLFFIFSPIVFYRNIKQYSVNDASFILLALLYIGIPFSYLILIRNYDIMLLVYVAVVAVLTDTFAYFTGLFLGKHKLIPEISPKKTIEGSIGGTLFAVVFGTMFFVQFIDLDISLPIVVLMSLILSILGQIGDLSASAIKRRYEIKDFGYIMPGHGGVLDRFDNLMFVIAGLVVFLDIFTNIHLGG